METPTSHDRSSELTELNRNLHQCNMLHGAVGSLNPRPPGLHNRAIQFGKKMMRRSLSWYTRPLHEFHAAVTRTLNGLARQAADSRSDVTRLETAWHQNIPAFLNAISSVNAFAHELVKVRRKSEQELASAEQRLSQKSEQELLSVDQRLSRKFERDLLSVEQRLSRKSEEELSDVRKELAELQKTLRKTSGSVSSTWDRVEFIRRELLFELKYGRRTETSGPELPDTEMVDAKVISQGKLTSARRTGLKLNLGCGHIPLDGYINVDRRELPGVDVVADVGKLPFDEAEVEEIFSAHLLEHFPQEMLNRYLLPVWRTLLKPGGKLTAIVPDGEAMLTAISSGSYAFNDFREVLFGAQDYDGDFHFNLFTPQTLSETLQGAGFTKIRVNVKGRPNGKCFECEVSAEKP